jgi:hypothetical protein
VYWATRGGQEGKQRKRNEYVDKPGSSGQASVFRPAAPDN